MDGGLAQMVERSLSMREVPGSMPGTTTDSSDQIHIIRLCMRGLYALFLYYCKSCTYRAHACLLASEAKGKLKGRSKDPEAG